MNKFSISYKITEYQEQFGEILTIEQAAFITGIKPGIVTILISHDLIETVKDHSVTAIHVKHIPKLKKVIRLHYDLGVGWNSMGLVLDLLNRIEELESHMEKKNS
ncbi:MAG TPA: chaperone modulator CbpM [Victivallales bacterium]|nr:chaperone modulator CbpM [Victivallales bacterium]